MTTGPETPTPTDQSASGDAASTSDSSPPKKPRSPRPRKKPRPTTISELIVYAYQQGDRKLDLTNTSMRAIDVNPMSATDEVDKTTNLALNDPFLNVPRNLLTSISELDTKKETRTRIVQLMIISLSQHSVFNGVREILSSAPLESAIPLAEVAKNSAELTSESLGLTDENPLTTNQRTQLTENAIISLALIRVLRDGWSKEQFIDTLGSAVWNRPIQPITTKAVSLLASSKAIDELSQVWAHHSTAVRRAQNRLDLAIADSKLLLRDTEEATKKVQVLREELEIEHGRATELQLKADQLAQELYTERDNRLVDNSHLVDDFENLRSRVLRRLSTQVDLLVDGLHALRNDRMTVADEFIERAIDAIKDEVMALKDINQGES